MRRILTTVPSGAAVRRVRGGRHPGSGAAPALAVGDPIISLGTNAKVVSALNRLGVSTVRQLADLAPIEVNRARRISPRIRRRIIELRAAVLVRFADEMSAEPVPTPATTVPRRWSPGRRSAGRGSAAPRSRPTRATAGANHLSAPGERH